MIEIYVVQLVMFFLGVFSIGYLWYSTKNKQRAKEITTTAVIGHVLIQVIAGIALYMTTFSNLSDVEIRNGSVVSKTSQKVSCEHSYSCRCRSVSSGSGKNRTTSRVCDTCYEHSYDVDWNVLTTLGTIEINRIDRRGINEPPRFTKVIPGEPAAVPFSYDNYIKVDPESIFYERGFLLAKYKNLPEYPLNFDYYRINRVLTVNKGFDKIASELNARLNKILQSLGSSKQVNIVVVLGSGMTDEYMRAIQQKWFGGKKNDLIAVINAENTEITNAFVFGFAKNSIVNINLRNDLIGSPFTAEDISNKIAENTNRYFVRRSMEEFKYLMDEVHVSKFALLIVLLIQVLFHASIHLHFKNKF